MATWANDGQCAVGGLIILNQFCKLLQVAVDSLPFVCSASPLVEMVLSCASTVGMNDHHMIMTLMFHDVSILLINVNYLSRFVSSIGLSQMFPVKRAEAVPLHAVRTFE